MLIRLPVGADGSAACGLLNTSATGAASGADSATGAEDVGAAASGAASVLVVSSMFLVVVFFAFLGVVKF